MLTSDTIFYTTFDAEPIVESVSGTLLNTIPSGTPNIVSGQFENACQLSNNFYLECENSISFSNQLTIGFWLTPVNPGIVTDPVNNFPLSLKMPVISKASFSISDYVTASSFSFIVWEETQDDNNNIMVFQLNGVKNGQPTISTITSSEYVAGSPHHFWMVYDGSNNIHVLFLDASLDSGSMQTGTIPTSLIVSNDKFCINNNVVGNLWEIARNQGIIDDLIIFSSAQISSATVVRAANNGAIYVGDTTYSTTDEIDQVAIFDDPGIAQINSVYSNLGKLYVARSDGQLLKGSKLLWESQRKFGNKNEEKNLTTVNKGNNGFIRYSLGSMKVQDKIIRV